MQWLMITDIMRVALMKIQMMAVLKVLMTMEKKNAII